ncbi:MAG: nucleotide exchange factor GrpE [Alcanivorax sp.]
MSNENNSAEEQPQIHEADTETNSAAEAPIDNSGDGLDLEYPPFSDEIDPGAAQKHAEPSEEQIRIQLLEEQLDRAKEQMVRALADAENTRRRAAKEREDASKFAVSSFARDLLSVADNLRRALDAVPEEIVSEFPQIKNLTDGIEATERELLKSFSKNGIVKLDPIDEAFDPNFHEVMFEAPMPDKAAGTIIQVMEPGYKIHERILRPARVGIAKNAEGQQPPPESSGHSVDTEV